MKKGRTVTLAPTVYRQLGQGSEYVRQAGFDHLQQEQMVIRYLQVHGKMARKDVMNLCRIGIPEARSLLDRLRKQGVISLKGLRKNAHYELPPPKRPHQR